MADTPHKDKPVVVGTLLDRHLVADESAGYASRNVIGVPVLSAAQLAASATGVSALNAGGDLLDLAGASILTAAQAAAARAAAALVGTRRKAFETALSVNGVVMNGTADDTAGFQAALDSIRPAKANDNGLRVVMPEGILGLGSTLMIPSRVKLIGQGKRGETVIKALPGFSGSHLIGFGTSADSGTGLLFDSGLCHMIVDCNNVTGLTGIRIRGWQEGCELGSVAVLNFGAKGIHAAIDAGWAAPANFSMWDLEIYDTSTLATATVGLHLGNPGGACHTSRVTVVGRSGMLADGVLVDTAGSVSMVSTHIERCTRGINVAGGDCVMNLIGVTGGTSETTGTLVQLEAPRSTVIGLIKNNATLALKCNILGYTNAQPYLPFWSGISAATRMQEIPGLVGVTAGAVSVDNRYADFLVCNTLTTNVTVGSPLRTPAAGDKLSFSFKQDATGGRTVTFSSLYKGVTLPAVGTANQSAVIEFKFSFGAYYQTSSSGWVT